MKYTKYIVDFEKLSDKTSKVGGEKYLVQYCVLKSINYDALSKLKC